VLALGLVGVARIEESLPVLRDMNLTHPAASSPVTWDYCGSSCQPKACALQDGVTNSLVDYVVHAVYVGNSVRLLEARTDDGHIRRLSVFVRAAQTSIHHGVVRQGRPLASHGLPLPDMRYTAGTRPESGIAPGTTFPWRPAGNGLMLAPLVSAVHTSLRKARTAV